eukprot:2557030-Amphidinium_carterae.1
MGEIAVAKLSHVPVVPVRMPDFFPMRASVRQAYHEHVDMTVLLEYGITLNMVQITAMWFEQLPFLYLEERVSVDMMSVLSRTLTTVAKRPLSAPFKVVPTHAKKEQETYFYILPDHRNAEAVATAMVLQLFLVPIMLARCPSMNLPCALCAGMSLPQHTSTLIAVMSAGCLESEPFLE